MNASNQSWSKWLKLAGTLISLGLLAWLLSGLDLDELLAVIARIPIWGLVLSLLLLTVRVFAHTYRWSALLKGQKISVPYHHLLGLQYGSFFASNFLPTTIGGDVIRIVGILRETSNRVGGAASVIVDRAMGAFAMLFALPLSWVALGGMLTAFGATTGRIELPSSLSNMAKRVWEATTLWFKTPLSLVLALLASWIGIFVYFLFIWVMARGMGIDVNLAQVAGITAVTYFIALIPFTINAYGLRELTVIALYTSVGATSEQAAALALISRFLILVSSLPGAYTVWGAFIGERQEEEQPDIPA